MACSKREVSPPSLTTLANPAFPVSGKEGLSLSDSEFGRDSSAMIFDVVDFVAVRAGLRP